MNIYCSKAGDTLDIICLSHYGGTHCYVEAVLMSNPGLADQGPILPAGIIIELSDLIGLKENKQRERNNSLVELSSVIRGYYLSEI